MSKDPRVYAAQILERLKRIAQYTLPGKKAFFSDPMLQDAVIRNLEVAGEASKRVPEDYRLRYPEIPWKRLAALRDILIHQYQGVSLPDVWEMVEKEVPVLSAALALILPPLDQLERELAEEE